MKAILTYHSVDDSGSVISVTRAELARHLDALHSRSVRIVPLGSLALIPADVDAVALTFDDGFSNFASAAAPLLVERTAPATVFVVPSFVGKANGWESSDSRAAVPQMPLMSWADVASVRSLGFDIGGHSQTHRSLRGLEPDILETEITQCAATIEERVGQAPLSFAFPYGDHDPAAVAAVARLYPFACTTRFDLLGKHDSPHELPRLDMYYFRGGRMLARWGSREFRGYVAGRKAARRFGNAIRGKGLSAGNR